MSGDRRPEEVAIAVRRPAPDGGVPRPSPLAGEARVLASRRGRRRVGRGAAPPQPRASSARRPVSSLRPQPLGDPLGYDLAGDPEPVRARFPAGTERIVVWPFVADAPGGLGADARRRARRRALARRRRRGRAAPLPGAEGDRAEGGRVRVGIDTSPLVQTRAGHGAARARPARRAGRPARPRARRAGGRRHGAPRLRPARRALVPVPPRARLREARRPPLHDLPRARLAARAARRHRSRPRRAPPPGGVPALAPDDGRASRCAAACARRTRSSRSRRSRATSSSTLLRVPVERIRVVPNGVDPVFTPDGPGRRGRLRPRGRDARAAEEPRRGGRGGAARGRRAARRRRRGLGRRRRRGLGRRAERRGARRADARRPLPRLSVAVRGLRDAGARGDGVRHARRDEPGRRDRGGGGRRGGARRPARPGGDRGGHRGGGARAGTSSSRSAARARRCSRGVAPPTSSRTLWRELA